MIHNPTTPNGTDGSVYHIITRQQPPGGASPSFLYQKMTDPVEPFGLDKVPHHGVLRLKDFPPNLQDLLLVSSTAQENIGILSRSKTPLASDKPADAITNVFTTTELADDSKRAQLPFSEDLVETFAVGLALDLSGKDKVYKPIPTDEINESPGPLPGLWALNNEGVLSVWWVVYNESIRSGTTYPGLAAGDAVAQLGSSTATSAPSAFGTPAASKPNPFGAPAPALASPFGTPSNAAPAFGGASVLGAKSSPWAKGPTAAAAPAFGSTTFGSKPATTTPAFGSPSAFGQMGGLGQKASPWASASPAAATPAFGQTGFAAAAQPPSKVFGSAAGSGSPASGGFASFANKGGFASLAGGSTPSSGSVFGSGSSGAFAAKAPEVSMNAETSFPPPAKKETVNPFGTPFVLGSTFKADPKTANDNEKPQPGGGGSLFGSGFGLSLNDDAGKQPSDSEVKDEEMDSTSGPTPVQENPDLVLPSVEVESTTPTTTPAPSRFDYKPTAGPPLTGTSLFGAKSSASTGSIFGATPAPSSGGSNIFGSSSNTPRTFASLFKSPPVKEEDNDKENLADIPKAPVPPESTSKAEFPLGDTSPSSGSSYSQEAASKTVQKGEDAPLPPDFLAKPSIKSEDDASKAKPNPEAAPLPPDFLPKKEKSSAAASKPAPQSPSPDVVLPKAVLAVPELPTSPEASEFSEEEEGEEEEEEGEEEEEEEDRSGSSKRSRGRDRDDSEEGASDEDESEGSGVDVAKDFSPTTGTGFGGHTPGFTPTSSFGKMAESGYSTISRSEAEPSRSLFGEVSRNAPPLFPAPVPQSPRSPSPVRGAIRPGLLRPSEPHRSVSAPGIASQILGRRSVQQPSGLGFAGSGFAGSPGFSGPPRPFVPTVDQNVAAQRRQAAAKREAEERVLVDPEDEGIQRVLQSNVEPTLTINEFLAVDSKLESGNTTGREEIPVACETLWRDVNRMIDRLGLNSRSLQSFILGHTVQCKDGGRRKEDLEYPDDWVMAEADELGHICTEELAVDLEDGRVKNIDAIETSIQHLTRDLAKLRAKEEDLRKVFASQADPEQLAVSRSLPLSAEQATQQNDLRRAFANFSKLLGEAEEALTLLRAKIASAGGASGKTPVPTVEAIIRTIHKMTSMAEKRSGDIDVLENQMRRLRFSSVSGLNGSPATRSREGSPFATPSKRSSIFSPDHRMRESMMSSPGGGYGMRGGTPARKKMSMFTEEEKKAIREKQAKRRSTLQLLRAGLAKSGPNVTRLRDDD